MVSVNFKLTDIGKIEVSIKKQQTLATVLQHCRTLTGVELGGIIAIRSGKVIREHTLIEDGDEIEIFPAISGG